MSRWHNGPNGPGICRARKGNCPFGGQDSHFSSKEDAFRAFNVNQEAEHGLLPKVNSDKTKDYKVRGRLSNGTNQSLSNFVLADRGYEERSEYLKEIVTMSGKDAHEVVDTLNNDKRIHGEWSVAEEYEDSVKFMSIDSFGNKGFVEVNVVKPKIVKREKGDAVAYSDNGIAMSLANYAHSSPDGTAGNRDYIQGILKDGLENPEGLADRLNNDNKVFGSWRVEREEPDKIILENKDTSGNIDYIEVYK